MFLIRPSFQRWLHGSGFGSPSCSLIEGCGAVFPRSRGVIFRLDADWPLGDDPAPIRPATADNLFYIR